MSYLFQRDYTAYGAIAVDNHPNIEFKGPKQAHNISSFLWYPFNINVNISGTGSPDYLEEKLAVVSQTDAAAIHQDWNTNPKPMKSTYKEFNIGWKRFVIIKEPKEYYVLTNYMHRPAYWKRVEEGSGGYIFQVISENMPLSDKFLIEGLCLRTQRERDKFRRSFK
jgi:hypothetical protein